MRINALIAVAAGMAALSATTSTGAFAQAGGGRSEAPAAVVDDSRLHSAGRDGDWITFGRDYSNQRFATFTDINRGNAARLAPVWTYPLHGTGATQTHPIIVGGVMYVSMAGNHVAAIDAATGAELWRYTHEARKSLPRTASNRGVAAAYGRIFEATDDGRIIALDQASGKLVWDKAVPPFDASALVPAGQKKPDVQFVMRAAPLAVDGLVIVGATGFEANQLDDAFAAASVAAGVDVGVAWINANLGRRGFLSAFDAKTGDEVWRWYTTKEEGWEGDYAEKTPDGLPLHRDIAAEKAAARIYRNAWAAGSNSTWMTPAFDAATGLIFIGTANPSPGDVDLVRPGDNLYGNGVAALDAKTGALRWFFQQSPHGQYDVTAQTVLFDAKAGGGTIPAIVECGKAGWCFVIDRTSGKLLFRTDEIVPHQNTYPAVAGGPPSQAIAVAPGPGGAVTVSPLSYDPSTGIVYVAGRHVPSLQTLQRIPNVAGGPQLFKRVSKQVPPDQTWGTLTALDLTNGGHAVWQVKTQRPLVGGTLATAGGLVFTGETSGRFSAFDAANGETLWGWQTGGSVGAPPVSYKVSGRQFIAVATGPAGADAQGSGTIRAFALP